MNFITFTRIGSAKKLRSPFNHIPKAPHRFEKSTALICGSFFHRYEMFEGGRFPPQPDTFKQGWISVESLDELFTDQIYGNRSV